MKDTCPSGQPRSYALFSFLTEGHFLWDFLCENLRWRAFSSEKAGIPDTLYHSDSWLSTSPTSGSALLPLAFRVHKTAAAEASGFPVNAITSTSALGHRTRSVGMWWWSGHRHFSSFACSATHSSVLAWRIPGTKEPSGLPSMRLHRDGHDWSDLAAAAAAAAWSLSL